MSHVEAARQLAWHCELCDRSHVIGSHDPGKEWPKPAAKAPVVVYQCLWCGQRHAAGECRKPLAGVAVSNGAASDGAAVIHRARGWSAHMKPKDPRKIMAKLQLPGDQPGLVRSLRLLASRRMLAGNTDSPNQLPCPRCSRPTATAAVRDRGEYRLLPPSVCTSCRAEWISAHVGWHVRRADMAAADAEIGDGFARFLVRLRAAKRRAGHDDS